MRSKSISSFPFGIGELLKIDKLILKLLCPRFLRFKVDIEFFFGIGELDKLLIKLLYSPFRRLKVNKLLMEFYLALVSSSNSRSFSSSFPWNLLFSFISLSTNLFAWLSRSLAFFSSSRVVCKAWICLHNPLIHSSLRTSSASSHALSSQISAISPESLMSRNIRSGSHKGRHW
ncbi:hypothetical protein M011DRAFT_463269 [Sporormia fimetaria CBS 119925]|uniref:Uncharacterized protein n=1 Tax=Sporormia fimetaria CBS 119925 TaxID=1340428 RepID=A0A6A6VR68_9PLEO|nr:hypothetical protein M011DRAFT_463269 [Sporormia fimetaria CBS 119925]